MMDKIRKMSLKNLFKHKLPIQFSSYVGNIPVGNAVGEDACEFTYVFKSDRIHDAKELGISKPLDIYEKLEPFLKYLISKVKYKVQFPYRTIVDVFLFTEELQRYKIIHFVLDDKFTHSGVLILQYFSNIFNQSFHLYIDVHCCCPPGLRAREGIFSDEEDEEDEDEDVTMTINEDGVITIKRGKNIYLQV